MIPMKSTALTITAAGLALAAAAALLPSLPANAAEPARTSASTTTTATTADATAVATGIPAGQWGIKATIDAVGVGLRFTDWRTQSDAGYQPGDITAGGSTRFFVTSDGYGHGVSADSTARIYNGSTPTGYYLKISVGDRTIARQAAHCTVYLGDPNAGGAVPAVSPYSCDVADNGGGTLGSEWFLTFSVHRANAVVISDPSQQQEYLRNCTSANCAYVATGKELFTGNELPYQSPYTNNTDHVSTMHVGETTEISNTTSFGTTLSSTLNVGDVWSVGVDLSYSDAWTYSTSFAQSEDIDLDPGQTGWFTIAPQMMKVTGDFYVVYHGTLYVIPGTTVDVPSASGATHLYSYTKTPGQAAVKHTFQ
jgi:hypothetical protein